MPHQTSRDPQRGRRDILPPPFGCKHTVDDQDAATVRLTGELDIATAPALAEALSASLLRSRLVVIDLRELGFIDSCGVRTVVKFSDRAHLRPAQARPAGGAAVWNREHRAGFHADRERGTHRAGADRGAELFDQGAPGTSSRGRHLLAGSPPPGASISPDNEVMARMRAGSCEALGDLYDIYGARAYRVARSVCMDQRDVEEAVQEGFVSIWNSRRSYVPRHATAGPWVMTLVRHRAIDILRRNARDSAYRAGNISEELCCASDIAADAENRDVAHSLRGLIEGLPGEQLAVITLAFYGELTHREIAVELGLPLGTVKGRMRLGLDKLRTRMDAEPQ